MTVWEIEKFKKFLGEKESRILEQVSSIFAKKIVSLVFEILQAELNYESENADKRFAGKEKA